MLRINHLSGLYGGFNKGMKTLQVTQNVRNFNLATFLISNGIDLQKRQKILVDILPNIRIGSASTSLYAFTYTPTLSNLILYIRIGTGVYIVGAGGTGGNGSGNSSTPGSPGSAGGPAIITSQPIFVINNGIIGGGGGGGGGGADRHSSNSLGAGGGGGAGDIPGTGGVGGRGWGNLYGNPGTLTSGGAGVQGDTFSGAGGSLGQPGLPGGDGDRSGGAGGAAGAAIVGISNITWVTKGTVLGPTS